MGRLPRIRQQLGKRERHTRPRAHSRVSPLQGITPQLYKHLDTNVQILIFGYTNQSYNHSLPTTPNFTMFIITSEYNSVNNNNKRPHVASDSSSSYSESEMSIASSRLAPSSSPDLFYLETTQLPLPMALGAKSLQFGTTETIPTVLFKDRKHLEDGEIPSQSEPLIPGSPLTSKVPAQVQIKVEHFEAVTNARETEAKTDAPTNASTTAATSTDSDKENKTPYAATSVSPEPEFSSSNVSDTLRLLYNTLHHYYGPPRQQTSFEKYLGPTWTDDEEEEEDDSDDNWEQPNPADKFEENAGIHPGEGWYLNDPFTKYFYQIEIVHPTTGQIINAPYVTFHIQLENAEVSATFGRGYAIVTKPLEPKSVCYHCPSLTPEQIKLLDPTEGHAQAVRQVIEDQFPLPLSAAFKRSHHYRRQQYYLQHHTRLLKAREEKYTEKAIEVLSQLENANVIGRLCAHEDDLLRQLTADHKRSDLFFELLRSYSGPVTLSALDARANPFRTGANKHHLRPDAQDKPRPADLTREYCPRCKHAVLPGHNDACKKEQLRQLAEERLQATADRIEDTLREKLHQRPQSRIPISTYKRCHKCYKVGHIRAQCPVGKCPWDMRRARK